MKGLAAQVRRGVMQIQVQFFQGGVKRQNHEGQVGINNADVYRDIGIKQANGFVDYPNSQQRIVNEPFLSQHDDPGINPQQKRSPEGQND